MESPACTRILAIDGGGTRCRIAVGDADGIVSVETGAANVSTDFDAAVVEILRGLDRLAARLDRPTEALVALPAFVGLAGVTGPVIADRLRAALPFPHVRIEDDRPAALRGALGHRNGVIAHCGTGSFFAAQIDGQMRFAGGWGPVLGDEASAQWVGRAALRMTLQTVDGRLGATGLSGRLLSKFGDAAGMVGFAGSARPRDFGALAPLVTEHAEAGDAIAQTILRGAAGEIARALPHLGWLPGQTICLTGGIGPQYARYLPEAMRAAVAEPDGEPLQGALSLALELAQETDDERR